MSVDNMKIRNILRAVMVAVSFVIILLYIGPVITVGEVNIGTLTGFGIAFILIIYSALFDRTAFFAADLCYTYLFSILDKVTLFFSIQTYLFHQN